MSHTYSTLYVHIVWSTKYRYPFIQKSLKERFYKYMNTVARKLGSEVIALNGMPDHVHLLMRLDPKTSVSFFMQRLKVSSTNFFRAQFQGNNADFSWQRGYGVFSVSKSQLGRVIAYIRRQEEHHKELNFYDEYIELLKRHGLYDDYQDEDQGAS